MERAILFEWVHEALVKLEGEGRVVDVAMKIWELHKDEFSEEEAFFYTWQYDMRWAATRLRKQGILKPADKRSKLWVLAAASR